MSNETRGLWLSLDGVEAAGKTTLSNALLERLPEAAGVAEFSRTPVGRYLAEATSRAPHYISESPIGQSLLFLGEFWERFETEVAPMLLEGRVVIHDRGYMCKYAYQHTVLCSAVGAAHATRVVDAVFATMPRPAVAVILIASPDVLRDRLIARGETCSEDRREFMVVTQNKMLEYRDSPGVIVIQTDKSTVQETVATITARLMDVTGA